ncbi:MAG: AAA family ATPase, partial [Chloroflexi bacterium]|nr:AAA family ATPase [Chloroflexota bacterium]
MNSPELQPKTEAVTAVKTVWMKDFRGVAEGQLNELTPLSILVGPNGSGKSTVLEALQIACAAPDQYPFGPVWQERPFLLDQIRWLHWRGLTEVQPIVSVMTGADRELTWQIQPQAPGGGMIRSAVGPEEAAGMDASGRVYFIRPPAPNQRAPLDKTFSEAVISSGTKDVAEMMQRLFGALDLRLLIEKDAPALFLTFTDYAIPVAVAGAGAEWLTHLGLSLIVPDGSPVLIEEPELHLHPAANFTGGADYSSCGKARRSG